MPRYRRYLEEDVLTAARKRMEHVVGIFDSVVVMFSGGKDSLVTLHLAREVLGTVDVVFRDEELIPQQVINFVNEYRAKPWVRMLYFAVPLASHKYVLGQTSSYVQWSPDREHVRPIPDHAIKLEPGDTRVFDQYSMDALVAESFQGRVAFLVGLRASESLIRYRSCVAKLHENYIVECQSPRVRLCKPIYDWEENDVFKYLHDEGIAYCPYYDARLWAGVGLRVSTPIHAEEAKRLHHLRRMDPVLYQQIVQVFPEMLLQERYYRDLERPHAETLDDVRAFLDAAEIDPQESELVERRFEEAVRAHAFDPVGYNPNHVLKYFRSGAYKRRLLPDDTTKAKLRREA